MSVVLNEAAITALLHAPEGPVRRDITRRAENARDALQVRINSIISNEGVRPQAGVQETEDGAVVGIEAHGSVADYIGFKLGVLEPWWEPFGKAAAERSLRGT